MALHIVLVEPEIPPNTGNIARSCAATGTVLHLVKPLGFSIEEKSLRRAGLDYWPYVQLEIHESLKDFLNKYAAEEQSPNLERLDGQKEVVGNTKSHRMFLATTKGSHLFTDFQYRDGDMFLFGKETAGLPRDFIEVNKDKTIRIPMSADTRLRSFNLANSANIILFEALRQLGFPDLE